ncbi:hypothetical protein CDO52_13125 [Nocardiopsis gilva YIM 90087]|uniref:Uncharacterized protein n=1 Tax=Nocardiopsis gilva YIM 90087 TaxID=1235441 RepID=A0A223S6F8_9ACTN|nr:hypothetical protein [Nocardiopsis gilva]ASU83609.1 hypothetical protein CDO52_13125 [Nocardiopsis gilva YIM 90087]
MRYLALVAYIAAAAWTAYDHAATPWFIVHASGAIAGVCALGLAGKHGDLDRELHGEPEPDQARKDIDRWEEEW